MAKGKWMQCIGQVLALPTFLLSFFPVSASAGVILQAHNMRFADIERILPDLKSRGISHVQISPPQKSNPAPDWWARYQPIDFTVIESPLGDRQQLVSLTSAADRLGIGIIADVVFNHMANFDGLPCSLRYPFFSPRDFHGDCFQHTDASYDRTGGWLANNLPDLRTEAPYVREQARNYLNMLLSLGVDGFRFDAAAHMDPGFFEEMKRTVIEPRGSFGYGEVIADYNRIGMAWEYTPHISVTDYPLLNRIVDAFSYGGDLRILKWPARENKALPGTAAVTFVNNHDIFEHPWDFGGLALDAKEQGRSPSDMILAHSYILARRDGFPLIFRNDIFHPLVSAGVMFHEAMLAEGEYVRPGSEYAPQLEDPNLLFIERGTRGWAVINKSSFWYDIPAVRISGLDTGCFRELHHNFTIEVSADGSGKWISRWGGGRRRGGMMIGPRDALFFVRSYDNDCMQNSTVWPGPSKM